MRVARKGQLHFADRGKTCASTNLRDEVLKWKPGIRSGETALGYQAILCLDYRVFYEPVQYREHRKTTNISLGFSNSTTINICFCVHLFSPYSFPFAFF